MTEVPYGTAEPRPGNVWYLRHELPLRHPLDYVWAAVATPAGLGQWLAVPDPWDPRPGAATAFTWQGTGRDGGPPAVDEGRITAWDPGRVAEYTLAVHGRFRFHLEPNGPAGTVLRLTNEVPDLTAAERAGRLVGWHLHLELLARSLAGAPHHWSTWSPSRYEELLRAYTSR